MMNTFTSIFHEEVIAIDEFKGEAEAYYAKVRAEEHQSGRHDGGYKAKKESLDKIRDKGSFNSKYIKHKGKVDIERTKNLRQNSAKGMEATSNKVHDTELSNRYMKKNDIAMAARRKAANESTSFLNFEII